MASDYTAITELHEAELGSKTASRRTQIDMYSGLAHFIYELLQNADDCGATVIRFQLFSDKLTIEHNGKVFSTENVKAISDFGESTSNNDTDKTGRFGVGFKSVFAYTATPIVHSGDESFEIFGLYRLREHPFPKQFDRTKTKFVLPFNHHAEKPDYVENLMHPKDAYDKIRERLITLNMNTLLFTKNLREIQWEVDDQQGHYLRDDLITNSSRRTTLIDGRETRSYRIFSRTPIWNDKTYKNVELAFLIDENEQPIEINDYLYVLFPTQKETHLKFVLNGPYRTNPARESIHEDDLFNIHLINETSKLLGDTLLWFKENKLLNTQLLAILPNSNDDVKSFFKPVTESIFDAFNTNALVPTDNDSFALVGDVLQGPAPIRNLFSNDDLEYLTGYEYWAKGVRPLSRKDLFLKSIGVASWGWKELESTLCELYGTRDWIGREYQVVVDDDDKNWMASKPDEWMSKLYLLLGEAIRKEHLSNYHISKAYIVRVRQHGEVEHVSAESAYFPKGGAFREIPQVLRGITNVKNNKRRELLRESLRALGVSDIGREESIRIILEKYYSSNQVSLEFKKHIAHMKELLKFWNESRFTLDSNFFSNYYMFRVEKSEQQHSPAQCYMDSPLRETGLSNIYDASIKDITQKFKLSKGYGKLGKSHFLDFARACGVQDSLQIEMGRIYKGRTDVGELFKDSYARNTKTGIDRDFYLQDMPKLLTSRNIAISRLIWRTMCDSKPAIFEAQYRPNREKRTRTAPSWLIWGLTGFPWIPDKNGRFKDPSSLTKDELHESLKYDNRNGWLDAIKFGENARKSTEEFKKRQQMATDLGYDNEIFELMEKIPEKNRGNIQTQIAELIRKEESKIRKSSESEQETIPFHEALEKLGGAGRGGSTSEDIRTDGKSKNPARRRDKLTQETRDSIQNEGSKEERYSVSQVRKWSGKNDLVRTQLREWYGGQCQICHKSFTTKGGDFYFEGVYLVSYTHSKWIDRVGNVLCLCPWHSAMFRHGPTEFEIDLLKQIAAFSPEAEGGMNSSSILLTMCEEEEEIRYVENHLMDLQVMVSESRKTGG